MYTAHAHEDGTSKKGLPGPWLETAKDGCMPVDPRPEVEAAIQCTDSTTIQWAPLACIVRTPQPFCSTSCRAAHDNRTAWPSCHPERPQIHRQSQQSWPRLPKKVGCKAQIQPCWCRRSGPALRHSHIKSCKAQQRCRHAQVTLQYRCESPGVAKKRREAPCRHSHQQTVLPWHTDLANWLLCRAWHTEPM